MAEAMQRFHSRVAPTSTSLAMSDLCGELSFTVNRWLRKRRKGVKPKLTLQQTEELQNVFQLMDGDGSGSIDTQELGAAFKLLGFDLHPSEVHAMVQEVDHDNTGEVEYNEFLEIMTETVMKLSENCHAGGPQVPFGLLATAYRRKKLLGGILDGTAASLAKVVKVGEDEEKIRGRESAEGAARKRTSRGGASSALLLAAQRSQLSPGLLEGMQHEELRAVANVNRNTLSRGRAATPVHPTTPASRLATPNRLPASPAQRFRLPTLQHVTGRRDMLLEPLCLSGTSPRMDRALLPDRRSTHLGVAGAGHPMIHSARLELSGRWNLAGGKER